MLGDDPEVVLQALLDALQEGASPADVARSVVTATSSSRFVVPNYWPDPKTGVGYQVQVEVPQAATHSTPGN